MMFEGRFLSKFEGVSHWEIGMSHDLYADRVV